MTNWVDVIYESTGWVVSDRMAQALGTLVETHAKGEIVLLRAEVEWLRDERMRLAEDLSNAHRAVLPWIEQEGFLNAEWGYFATALKKISTSTDATGDHARQVAQEALDGSKRRCE